MKTQYQYGGQRSCECGHRRDRHYVGGPCLRPDCDCAKFASESAPETVRDLAQAIITGNAFTDADAVRVARAYLDEGGETA